MGDGSGFIEIRAVESDQPIVAIMTIAGRPVLGVARVLLATPEGDALVRAALAAYAEMARA